MTHSNQPDITEQTPGDTFRFVYEAQLEQAAQTWTAIHSNAADDDTAKVADLHRFAPEIAEPPIEPRRVVHTIQVFDFDGTLFLSPSPNPHLWDNMALGMIQNPSIGWYQDIRTLSEPYVVHRQAMDSRTDRHATNCWFNSEVLQRAKQAINEPGTFTVLLTGRRQQTYYTRISQLLAAENLRFDVVILREDHPSDQYATTMAFKQRALDHVLCILPSARDLIIWEDRGRHVRQFQAYISAKIATGRLSAGSVVQVSHPGIFLPRALELTLVRELVNDYNGYYRDRPLEIVQRSVVAILRIGLKDVQLLCRQFNATRARTLSNTITVRSSCVRTIQECQSLGVHRLRRVPLMVHNARVANGQVHVTVSGSRPFLRGSCLLGRPAKAVAAAIAEHPVTAESPVDAAHKVHITADISLHEQYGIEPRVTPTQDDSGDMGAY